MNIGRVLEITTLAVSIGFSISLIYNWGFLYALDVERRTLPIAVADHFDTGALWFPELAGILIFLIAIELFFNKLERGMTEEEIIASTKYPKWWSIYRNGPKKLTVITLICSALVYMLIGGINHQLLPLATALMWYIFAAWTMSEPRIRKQLGKGFRRAYTVVPACFFAAFFYGYTSAVSAAIEKPVIVTIEDSEGRNQVRGKFLRSFERGVLYMNKENNSTFVLWSEIGNIRWDKEYKGFSGILCEWFGICNKERFMP